MSSKAIKIAVTCVVLAAAFGGLLYTTLVEGTEYYKHVDEVMTTRRRGKASSCSCTATSPSHAAAAELARLPLQGAEQRQGRHAPATRASCPTRSRTRRKSC